VKYHASFGLRGLFHLEHRKVVYAPNATVESGKAKIRKIRSAAVGSARSERQFTAL